MTTVPGLIARASKWFAGQVAVEDADRSLTFHEVDDRSNRFANALIARCPEPGSRTAVLSPNRAELVEIDFAIAKSGKIRVPINTRLKPDECEWVLSDSAADVLVADASYEEQARAWLRDIDSLRSLILIDGCGDNGYEDTLSAGSGSPVAVERDLSDGSFILYTSGTTGRPKGAVSTVGGRLAATSAML